jgi:hypothetical protein
VLTTRHPVSEKVVINFADKRRSLGSHVELSAGIVNLSNRNGIIAYLAAT